MHLLYVDESGDTGRHNPQNHTFVLCGLMIHHADWHEARSDLLEMRSRMEQIFGLPKAAEIHASQLLGRSPSRFGLDRTARIKAALHQVEMIRRQGSLFAVRVIVICDDHRTAPGSGWLDSVQKSLDMESILPDQPFGRDSRASDFLQACDMLAYLTKQTVEPAGFFSRNNSRWLVERCERMFGERGLSFHPEWKGGA
jgi:hypothetical protein